jgi:hypothetical protein
VWVLRGFIHPFETAHMIELLAQKLCGTSV